MPLAVTLCLCLLLATACDEKNPIGPTVPVDQRFVIGPGEVASIEGTAVRIRFEEVTSDSRCPIDAICIQAGDAVVVIRVFAESSSASQELHTSDPSRRSVTYRDVRIELLELQPYPVSSRPTDPAAYRATFRASRSG
jgi:hypothetical protein